MTSKEPDAKAASRKLLQVAIDHIAEMFQSDRMIWQLKQKVQLHPVHGDSLSITKTIDGPFVAFRAAFELRDSTDFAVFEQAIEADAVLGARIHTMVGTPWQSRQMTPFDFFQVLLAKVLDQCEDGISLSLERFDDAWDSTTKLATTSSVKVRYWSIISNLEIPHGATEILPGILLRGLSNSEAIDQWNRSRFLQDRYPFESSYGPSIEAIRTLLESTTEEPVIVGRETEPQRFQQIYDTMQSDFDSVCASIRLLKHEPILMSRLFVEVEDIWSSAMALDHQDWIPLSYTRPCILSREDMNELQKLLKTLLRAKPHLKRSTLVCLRRINFANTRTSLEDKLLDVMMALENLVLQDSGGELSFRLAIRLAKFLSTDVKEQHGIFDKVRRVYKVRNKIVHGQEMDQSDTGLVGEIESLAKLAIRKDLHSLSEGKPVDWDTILFT